MSGKFHKKMRRQQTEEDNVLFSCCNDCGGYSEIKENDKSALLSALNSGCIVMMLSTDFNKNKKRRF
jgi:hypothetical protein